MVQNANGLMCSLVLGAAAAVSLASNAQASILYNNLRLSDPSDLRILAIREQTQILRTPAGWFTRPLQQEGDR